MREAEALRDRIFHGLGTDEVFIFEGATIAATWRKPLRIDEIARMAATPEVRLRPGRA